MAKTVKTGQVNAMPALPQIQPGKDRKSTRLNSSH